MPKCNGKSRGSNIRRNSPKITHHKRHLYSFSNPSGVACGNPNWDRLAEGDRRNRVTCQRCLYLMSIGRA